MPAAGAHTWREDAGDEAVCVYNVKAPTPYPKFGWHKGQPWCSTPGAIQQKVFGPAVKVTPLYTLTRKIQFFYQCACRQKRGEWWKRCSGEQYAKSSIVMYLIGFCDIAINHLVHFQEKINPETVYRIMFSHVFGKSSNLNPWQIISLMHFYKKSNIAFKHLCISDLYHCPQWPNKSKILRYPLIMYL